MAPIIKTPDPLVLTGEAARLTAQAQPGGPPTGFTGVPNKRIGSLYNFDAIDIETRRSSKRSALKLTNLRYPDNVTDYVHLDLSAWQYTLPSVSELNNRGLGPLGQSFTKEGKQFISRGRVNGKPGGNILEPTKVRRTNEDGSRLVRQPGKSESKRQKLLFRTKMYVPGGFGEKFSTNWERESIAMIGSTANVNSLFDVGADIISGTVQHAIQNFLTRKRDSVFGRASESLQAFTGKRIAPLEAKVFKGSEGRSLPLDFLFAPRNVQEGRNMLAIIDSFRQLVLPFIDAELFKGLVLLYDYPPLWDIKVMPGYNTGSKQEVSVRTGTFFEYRDMALTNLDISYSDDTLEYTHFGDGIPTSAKMSLQFESIFPAIETNISKDGIHHVAAEAFDGGKVKATQIGTKRRGT